MFEGRRGSPLKHATREPGTFLVECREVPIELNPNARVARGKRAISLTRINSHKGQDKLQAGGNGNKASLGVHRWYIVVHPMEGIVVRFICTSTYCCGVRAILLKGSDCGS